MTTEAVDYVLAYGGRCRDCADNTGVCPISGLPCADPNKAVHHIIKALRYGIKNGFVPAFEAGGKVSAGGDIDAVRVSFLKGWDACWCRKPDSMDRDGGRQKAWQKYRASLDHNHPRSNFTLHRAEPLPPAPTLRYGGRVGVPRKGERVCGTCGGSGSDPAVGYDPMGGCDVCEGTGVLPDLPPLTEAIPGFDGFLDGLGLHIAQGIEAGTAKTEGLGPKDESPVPEGDAPEGATP